MKRAKTVFVLGAGASRMSGGPLISNFIGQADGLRQDQRTEWAAEHFDREYSARKKLQRAYARANLDIDNIEDLFSAYEAAQLIGLDTEPVETIALLPQDLRFIIMRTLEHCIKFPILLEDEMVFAPEPFDAFVELVDQLLPTLGPISIVSFNYDLSLDYALSRKRKASSYGFDLAPSELTILKLHGSLNWTLEPGGHIHIAPVTPLDSVTQLRWLGLDEPVYRPISTMELMHGPNHRYRRPEPEPFIVPPTWNKQPYSVSLTPVWKRAKEAISMAENVFVIGFSLAPADQSFRAFWALSCLADSITQRFWVFDPSQEVGQRYQKLLGPAILLRNRFQWLPLRFEQAITKLVETFRLKKDPFVRLERKLGSVRPDRNSGESENPVASAAV